MVEDTPMVTRIQHPPLLPRPPIQRQDKYTDQEQAGRTRLASNKRGGARTGTAMGRRSPSLGTGDIENILHKYSECFF